MRKSLLLIILSVLAVVAGKSQVPSTIEARVRSITMDDGLASNTVRALLQDRIGFIWMGSDAGLCRYDGISIKTYYNVHAGYDQFVSCLFAYNDSLVVGTSHGAYFFDLRKEQFYPLSPKLKSMITSATADAAGRLWLSTQTQGVYRYDPRTGYLKHFAVKEARGRVSQVFADADNQVWLYTLSSSFPIMRLNHSTDSFYKFRLKGSVGVAGGAGLAQDAGGHLWVGSWNDGLYTIGSDGSVSQVLNPTVAGYGQHIHHVYAAPDGSIFIACDDGYFRYNPKTGSWTRYTQGNNFSTGGDRFIYCITSDRENGLWMGTFYGGVNYISPVGTRFDSFTTAEGLSGHVVGRFCEDSEGHIWIATDDGGLNCYNPSSKSFVNYPGRSVMAPMNIHALCIVGNYLWTGTYTSGIVRLDLRTGSTKTYTAGGSTSCYAIHHDSAGRLWATTMSGVCLYDPKTDSFRNVRDLKSLTIDIDHDRYGNIWFSTQGEGLWRYSPRNRQWRQYKHSDKDSTSLPSNDVNCCLIDAEGRQWIATANGICQFNPKTGRFYRLKLHLPTEDIKSVIEDQGILWMATSIGLVRWQRGSEAELFNRFDGLVGGQFQHNSALLSSSGIIYLGSSQGFSSFSPFNIVPNSVPPRAVITGLRLFNHPIEVGSSKLPESLGAISRLDLNHNDDVITLSFASLSYCTPEKNRYAYKLEGFDKEWNYVGQQHEATYTNLPSGTYTFRVKATNNDGRWSRDEATLRIVVHPPFWWSWYAWIVYLLIIITAIWRWGQWRVHLTEKRHQQEMRRLKNQQEQQTKDQRLRFFTMIAHEIRTPVSLIIGPVEELRSGQGDRSRLLEIVDRNAHRLLDLVNQLLDFNKVQQQGLELHFAVCNIRRIMEEVAERFQPTIEQKGYKFSIVYPDPLFTAIVDHEGLTKIISNLMTNAVKYTKDEITLSCEPSADGSQFSVMVKDNGIGISKTEQKKIFREFYQSRDNKPGTGIGLSIVNSLVKLHHGSVSVDSEPGHGSTFKVTLPVSQDVAAEADTTVTAPDNRNTGKDEKLTDTLPSEETGGEELKPTVLIVEDDADLRSFLSAHFQSGYQVLTAANGREALDQLHEHSTDLIVSDWMMPEMDGEQLCRAVRADKLTSHIPFIMLTAKTDDDSKAGSMDCGADAFIGKPFSMKYLQACIRRLIESRKEMVHQVERHPKTPVTALARTAIDSEMLSKLTQIVEDNLDNKEFSVSFLAAQIGISRSGLFSKIKALTGKTPNELVMTIRLRKAAGLLASHRHLINEVAYMVGFSSPSYFSKCFQKQFGVKPGEYDADASEE